MNWKLWLKGLMSTIISGASSAVASWLALNVVKPDLMKGMSIIDTFHLLGVVALFAGLGALVNFLKQSPLPNGGEMKK